MKNNVRFLKKITVLSVIMNIIITFSALYLCYKQNEITAGILSALLGAWSIELCLTAFIKNTEQKENSNTNNLVNNSNIEITEPDPEIDSI